MLNHRKIQVVFLLLVVLFFVFGFFTAFNWWYFVALFGVYFIILAIGSSFLQLNFHVKAYCHNPNINDKKIALTFDDGPHEITPDILKLLKQYKAKATFFCIGKNAQKYPETLKQIVEEGHLIGNHSYSHSHFFDFYGEEKVTEELKATDAVIEKIIGKKPAFFRPPYGVTNPAIRKALDVTKHKTIGWNIRSMDGVSKDEKGIYNRIIKQVAPGSIVLLHDTSATTVSVLEQLLLFLHAHNYEIIGIDELLNLKPYEN